MYPLKGWGKFTSRHLWCNWQQVQVTKGDTNVDVRTEDSDMVAPLPPLVGQSTDCSVIKTPVDVRKLGENIAEAVSAVAERCSSCIRLCLTPSLN